MGLTPTIDGKVHHFGACGLMNGLAILRDAETESLWDHITGEAFDGPLQGHKLDVFPMQLTTAAALRQKDPEAKVYISNFRSFLSKFLGIVMGAGFINSKGTLPPFFKSTMNTPIDPRQPKLEQGLGVMHKGAAKFYPMHAIPKQGQIEDEWAGGTLILARGEIDRVPFARWKDADDKPMQMLSRWYGFAFTYPKCEVYEET